MGFRPDVLSSPHIEDSKKIHVDLLGSYYQMIVNSFLKNEALVAAEKTITALGTYALTSICHLYRLGLTTKLVLGTMFTKDHTTLYLDGKTTKEKETTANLRRQVKEKDEKKWKIWFVKQRRRLRAERESLVRRSVTYIDFAVERSV